MSETPTASIDTQTPIAPPKRNFLQILHLRPQEKLPTPPTRIVDLSTPHIDGKFPLQQDQLVKLSESSKTLGTGTSIEVIKNQESLDLYYKQRERFQDAKTVIAECRSIGLGDCFNNVRYALLLAEQNPEKEVLIVVTQPISEMSSLRIPPNAKLVTDFSEKILDDQNTFVYKFELTGEDEVNELIGRNRLNKELLAKYASMELHGRYGTYQNSLAYPWDKLANILGIDSNALSYNINDLINAVRLQFLGVRINEEDMRKPVTNMTESRDYLYDLLIVPDAGETEWNGRSLKSLSPEKWDQVFARLPRGLRVGIVMGHDHPKYTRRVFSKAKRHGLQVHKIKTLTLEDFRSAVLASRKYVGGDTGPTHIARDAIKTAHASGREIAFRELYDESIHALKHYGTVGNGEDGKMLVTNTNIPSTQIHPDLDRIDPQTVANFIVQ